MKHKLLTFIVALALSSCAVPSPTPSPTLLPPSATTTQPSTRSPTPIPIQSPAATSTAVDSEDVVVCPVINPDLKPDFSLDISANDSVPKVLEPSLDFLNSGGSPDALGIYLNQSDLTFYKDDLTGDGIPEISLGGTRQFDIIGCNTGKYIELLDLVFESPISPGIYSIRDMNLNGIPDVVIYGSIGCSSFSFCFSAGIYEWDTTEFRLLTKDLSSELDNSLSIERPFGIQTKDIDGNGTLELILDRWFPYWHDSGYRDGLPWRDQNDFYKWNGEAYIFYRTEYASPEYRFQAVQDGDQAILIGKYDQANDFYQQAIFDEDLKTWSAEWQAYEQALWDARQVVDPPPTPFPTPTPDPAEYPNLAAYARYRIMLLHLQQGYVSDAKVVYDTLQQKFPPGQAGHAYAEMAEAFWASYQDSHTWDQACSKAIEYAASHKQEILSYIGIDGDYHGWQSHDYAPEDVCPFQ